MIAKASFLATAAAPARVVPDSAQTCTLQALAVPARAVRGNYQCKALGAASLAPARVG